MTQILKVIILILISSKAFACECINEFSEFTPLYLSEYNHIFVGKVISVDTVGNTLQYHIIPTKSYWGENRDTMLITTARPSGMCGLLLDLNETYLIYGQGDRVIYSNSCGPSRKLNASTEYYFGDWNPSDSIRFSLNGEYKKRKIADISDYLKKAFIHEIEKLETISLVTSGTLTTEFINNSISGQLNFKDGKLNGINSFYFSNGKLKSQGNFDNNIKTGIWKDAIFKTVRNKDFYLMWTGQYSNNKKTGKWKGEMLIGTYKELRTYYGYNLNNDY